MRPPKISRCFKLHPAVQASLDCGRRTRLAPPGRHSASGAPDPGRGRKYRTIPMSTLDIGGRPAALTPAIATFASIDMQYMRRRFPQAMAAFRPQDAMIGKFLLLRQLRQPSSRRGLSTPPADSLFRLAPRRNHLFLRRQAPAGLSDRDPCGTCLGPAIGRGGSGTGWRPTWLANGRPPADEFPAIAGPDR